VNKPMVSGASATVFVFLKKTVSLYILPKKEPTTLSLYAGASRIKLFAKRAVVNGCQDNLALALQGKLFARAWVAFEL